jgi:hypothetical protein
MAQYSKPRRSKSARAGARALATFTVPMKVEIREPEFEPLGSLDALDVRRLSRGNHKVEVGFLKGGCCRNLVRAVIRNGMVTGFEVEGCKETADRPAPPELRRVLEQARRKLSAGRQWKPIPVSQLVRSSASALRLIIIIGGGCIFICVWGHCIMCCWNPRPHCFIPDIIVGPL